MNNIYTHESSPLSFSPISPETMSQIWPYLRHESGRTTDFSYGGILMWVDYFQYKYCIFEDTLFIKGTLENDISVPAFALPIGRLSLCDSLKMLKQYCEQRTIPFRLSAVPEYAINDIRALFPDSIVSPLPHWGDYLYDAQLLSTLKGKKMNKKRNHINKFKLLYPDWHLVKIDNNNLKEALLFMERYQEEADFSAMAVTERELTKNLLLIASNNDSELKAMALQIDGEIAAITIGDMKGDTLFIHVEKALREFEGSYEMINQQFAQYICNLYPEIKYINREDDAGDEGLRMAKESYHPIEILNKFNVTFQ